MNGYLAAAVAVLIAAAYPVATRAAVTGTFSPQELVTLRFGVGALLFLPYLLLRFRAVPRRAWVRGLPLTLFQGAGMVALVIAGLQFAPASHQAALGPGTVPAWVAILGALFLARRPSARVTAGAVLCAIGAFALTFSSSAQGSSTILAGDAMFLCASALGAIYVLQLRNSGVNALQAAALVTVYSAVLVVPWQLWVAPMPLWRADPLELVWQIVWQGVLTACVSLIAFNHAVTRLGAERACALIAFVPVLSALFGFAFLGEVPSLTELAAILTVSLGVSIGAARSYGGNPASTRAATSRPA